MNQGPIPKVEHASRAPGAMHRTDVQILLVVAMGVVWGAAFPANRYAMTHGMLPLGYTFWVFVVASAVGVAVCAARGIAPRTTREFLLFTLFTGIGRCAIPVTLISIASQHIPAGLMVMISSTSGIVVYGGAVALKRERFHWVRFAGVVSGLIGVSLILVPGSSLPDPAAVPWVMFAFLVPLLFAATTLTIDYKRPKDTPTLVLTAGMFIWAAIALFPLAIASGSFYWPNIPPRLIDGTMVLHGTINGIAFIGLFELIRIAGVVIATQTTYITPVAGVLWGVLLLGEQPSGWLWAALGFIVGGLFLVNLIHRAAARRS